jgi:mRNA deadenylase 3'-5' endonuclease subunit Ccr4
VMSSPSQPNTMGSPLALNSISTDVGQAVNSITAPLSIFNEQPTSNWADVAYSHRIARFSKQAPLPSSGEGQFTILSWNILADCFTQPENYMYAGEYALWSHRKPLLFDLLSLYNPDVICLQEMMFVEYPDFEVRLAARGYSGVVQSVKSKGKGSNDHPVGLATFFRTSKFQLVWQEHRSRCMALGLVFVQPSSQPQHCIAVANVHLESAWKKYNIRFQQLKSLFDQLQKHTFTSVIVLGDFNNRMNGCMRKLMLEGHVDALFEDHGVVVTEKAYSHPHKFHTVYSESDPTFVMPDHHYFLDHICFSYETLRPKGALELMTEEDRHIILATSLPNRTHPSDHLPVAALFEVVDSQ